ncbi:MAG: hypothetical protein ACM3YN_05900 [Parcubacteria group bacterium]
MPTDMEGDWDDQDQSEVFDEDNQNLDSPGGRRNDMRTLEEMPDVLDVTSAVGDADDDEALIAEELDDDEIIELEADAELADFEDDDLAGRLPEELFEEDVPGVSRADSDEVELVYRGDLDDRSVRDGKRTAAMESRSLTDEDLEDLGYPGDYEPGQDSSEAETQRKR